LNGVFRYVVGVDKDLHLKELELVMKEYIVEKNHTNVISVIISLPREQVWMFIFKHITKSLPVIKQLKSIPSSRKQNDLAMVKTTPLPQKMNNWCGMFMFVENDFATKRTPQKCYLELHERQAYTSSRLGKNLDMYN